MSETSNLALSTTSETNDGHTDKKKHKCDVCSKLFRFKYNLVQHKNIHTNEKNHKCDVCSKLFRRKFSLVQHKNIHTNEKNHKCDVCSKLFRRKSYLEQHKKVHTNEKNHKCDVCSKLFHRKFSLVQHKNIHTNEKNHKCDVCSKLFHRKPDLVRHQKIHMNEKNHKCDVCSKLFHRKSYLVQHKKIHMNEKNHKCDVCSKLFHLKSSLLRHKRIHTNEKKSYQCFECGKDFTYRDSIIKHLQLHKKFPFKCDKCKKVFISAVQLKSHYRVHIREKLFSCNLCAESFLEKRKLKSHVKHIHNDTERDVILQPYDNFVSLREAESERCKESGMKSCHVVLERFQIESNMVYDMMGINSSKPADNAALIEVKVELEESKPFNPSIIYKEEDVEDGVSITNCCVTSSEKSNMVHDMMGIYFSKPVDNVPPIEVKVELEESKPLNPSIIYNEEDVEDGISLRNGCVTSSAIDEVKQENSIVKLENYDDVESSCEEKLEGFVG